MHEYVVQAVILDREPFREFDNRVTFFTERLGKLSGKSVSTRKITSKLAAHLEPGAFVNMRFVEKSGLQIVDSLTSRRLRAAPPDLHALKELLPEGEPEPELWNLLKTDKFSWREALRILGWDPNGAQCATCGKTAVAFHAPRQEMFCAACASKLPPGQVLYW